MSAARRLTARSVLASTLLGVDPPVLPTRALVGTAAMFGISAGTARVAISRMVASGELVADGDGYRLASPSLLARRTRQDQSRTGTTVAWTGRWRVALVDRDARPAAERAELRGALTALRFAEIREGAWLRPDNLERGVLDDAERVVAAQCLTLTATLDAIDGLATSPEPGALARRLWDLDGWATEARRHLADLDRLDAEPNEGPDDPDRLAAGFMANAATLRHFQADPLLPPDLLPADWPGDALRTRHAAFDARFKARIVGWQRHLDRAEVGG